MTTSNDNTRDNGLAATHIDVEPTPEQQEAYTALEHAKQTGFEPAIQQATANVEASLAGRELPYPLTFDYGKHRAKEVKTLLPSIAAVKDALLAERLMERYADRLLAVWGDEHDDLYTFYVLNTKTGIWTKDRATLQRVYLDLIDGLKQDVFTARESLDGYVKYLSALDAMRTKAGFAGALFMLNAPASAQADLNRHPALTMADHKDLNANGRYLGCLNGVVDLKTGQLIPAANARKHLITKSTPHPYYPDAAIHPDAEKLTAHLGAEDYLWGFMGRALWGVPSAQFLVIVGKTNWGKSTFTEAIKAALGPQYTGDITESAFGAQHKDRKGGPTSELLPLLAPTRIVIGAEAAEWKFGAERIKALADNGNTIPVQPKFKEQFHAPVTATIVLHCNDIPTLHLLDGAVRRRFRLVEWTEPPSEDTELKQRIHEPAVAQAVLAKLIQYAKQQPKEPPLMPGTIAKAIEEAIAREGGNIYEFCTAMITESAHSLTPTSDMFAAYKDWAAANDIPEDDIKAQGDVTSSVRKIFGLKPVRTRRIGPDKKVKGCLSGVRLATAEELTGAAPALYDPKCECLDTIPIMSDTSIVRDGVWLFGLNECVRCKMISGHRVDFVTVADDHTPEQIDAILANDDEAGRTSGMWDIGYRPHYSDSGGAIEWNIPRGIGATNGQTKERKSPIESRDAHAVTRDDGRTIGA